MRLTLAQLAPFGDDAGLIHFVDTVFPASLLPAKVGVAVSGGGDSMALLQVAQHWSVASGVPIAAVTVDHGLRPEAVKEAEMVGAFCARIGVPHTVLNWDGRAAQGNIAAAGRDARYRLMGNWARSRGIGGVLLGHTVDDIAETFLMRLARKSGVDGLAAMDHSFRRYDMIWARPFWQQSRARLREYLTRHGIEWVDDPTNEDESLERPKARKILSGLAPLGIDTEVLKAVALNMATARSALDYYTHQEARRIVRQDRGDILIQKQNDPPVPPEIERRLMIAALGCVTGAPYAPRTDAMLKLEIGLMQAKKHTLAGCLITKEQTEIRISREFNAVKQIQGPWGEVWDNRWAIDGLGAAHLTIRALGERIAEVPDWRTTGLPRASLMASPAVFDDEQLIAAPVAGLKNGFEARIVADFASFLESR